MGYVKLKDRAEYKNLLVEYRTLREEETRSLLSELEGSTKFAQKAKGLEDAIAILINAKISEDVINQLNRLKVEYEGKSDAIYQHYNERSKRLCTIMKRITELNGSIYADPNTIVA